MIMTKEQRRHERAKRELTIRHRLYKHKGASVEGDWQISKTCDMSLTGILFKSGTEYKKGDIVELVVVMSGAIDVFKGFCRVVRVENPVKREPYYRIAAVLAEKA